jgi:hypothetical protein
VAPALIAETCRHGRSNLGLLCFQSLVAACVCATSVQYSLRKLKSGMGGFGIVFPPESAADAEQRVKARVSDLVEQLQAQAEKDIEFLPFPSCVHPTRNIAVPRLCPSVCRSICLSACRPACPSVSVHVVLFCPFPSVCPVVRLPTRA